MKNSIILFSIIFLTLSSCGEDMGSTEENYFKLPDSVNFFSNDFINASQILFTNKENKSLVMDISSTYGIKSVKNSGKEKFWENREIVLSHIEYPHYPILFNCKGIFKQGTDNVYPFLHISFMRTSGNDALIGTLDINNIFVDMEIANQQIHNDLLLNGREFNNVYIIANEENQAYSELYYSKEIGVVAFRDEKNDLWVYEKIIE